MAILSTSSASTSLLLLSSRYCICSPYPSPKPNPNLSFLISSPPPPLVSLSLRHRSATVAASSADVAQPETIEPPAETLEEEDKILSEDEESELPAPSSIISEDDVSKMAPKQKIRIKLKSYWVPLIEDSVKQILEAARTTNAKIMGPVPLPTKRRVHCVLRSPHVHKDARFHFEIRTHRRMLDILHPTADTIDKLMHLQIPAGVDVEVKL